jgi:hypothetical protein
MHGLPAAGAGTTAFHAGLIFTALGFGFRHGIDWDHIAALTDITTSQQHTRRSMYFATLYALGHALVVSALGFAAIVLGARLPSAIDATTERIVGVTLIGLGFYVFYALASQRRTFRMRSRWMLLFAGVRKGRRWASDRSTRTQTIDLVRDEDQGRRLVNVTGGRAAFAGVDLAPVTSSGPPDDPFVDYAPRTAFGVGMLHGVGAETPTQLLIFLTAAGAGGRGAGLLLLGFFLVGLLTSNTVVAFAGAFGFLGATRNFAVYVAVSVVTATFSLAIGFVFLAGGATGLPTLLGG